MKSRNREKCCGETQNIPAGMMGNASYPFSRLQKEVDKK